MRRRKVKVSGSITNFDVNAKWWPVNCETENFRGHKGNVKIKMEYSDIVERHFYVDTGEVKDSG
jgi:hypothetical protein